MRSLWLPTAAIAAVCLPSVMGAADTTACKTAARLQVAAAQGKTFDLPDDLIYATFDAETAYNCVTSIPFNADEATAMIGIAKEYCSFQTTLAYLKDPPASYQQPAVDLMDRLDKMAVKCQDGSYTSQYEFDVDLWSIVIDTHEEHFAMSFGLLRLFTWFLNEALVTVSTDGKSLPQVYAYSDIKNDIDNASPIVQIEGQSVFEYIRDYAERTSAIGLIDPHADWNQLMSNSPRQFGLSGSGTSRTYWPSFFESTIVYNGASVRGSFANGTDFEWPYYAGTPTQLANVNYTTPENVYQWYVVNADFGSTVVPRDLVSATVSEVFSTPTSTPEPTGPTLPIYTKVPYLNYPSDPVVIQDQFAVGGTVSGYFLEDISVGVLSLPSFVSSDATATARSFSIAVKTFIQKASRAGMKKIIIDISGNGGGSVFLGYDTFKQFFPTIEPSLEFRTRAFSQINTLGKILTPLSRGEGAAGEELTPENIESIQNSYGNYVFINAAFSETPQGDEWESWDEFYGPVNVHGDNFTNSASWNLSSPVIAHELNEYIAGYGNNVLSYDQPWSADDIILLSDGSCGSTCSIFSELMKTDAGVKTVVVGGIPQYGPMQSVCGTRGSNDQTWKTISSLTTSLSAELTSDPDSTTKLLDSYGITEDDLKKLPTPLEQAPWQVHLGAFNALDEIRPGSPDDPLHFTYEAADCRLFYTAPMIRDVTQLWRAAAKYLDGDDSVCVDGSTDGPGAARNTTVTKDPGYSYNQTWANANSTDVPSKGVVSDGNGDDNDDNDADNSDDGDSGASALTTSLSGLVAVVFIITISWF